jgi:hypothetical protein
MLIACSGGAPDARSAAAIASQQRTGREDMQQRLTEEMQRYPQPFSISVVSASSQAAVAQHWDLSCHTHSPSA